MIADISFIRLRQSKSWRLEETQTRLAVTNNTALVFDFKRARHATNSSGSSFPIAVKTKLECLCAGRSGHEWCRFVLRQCVLPRSLRCTILRTSERVPLD